MTRPGRAWRRCLGAMSVLVLLSACIGGGSDGGEPTEPDAVQTDRPDPCPDVVPEDLGVPKRTGRFAEFTLDAPGTVWVSATGFPHGGAFDPEVGRSAVYVGGTDALPTYDESSSTVTNALVDTAVVEGTWTAMSLGVGSHWLWSSAGVEVSVKTCEGPALSDVVRAPPG